MLRPELGKVSLSRAVKRRLTTAIVDRILDGHVLGESPDMPLGLAIEFSSVRYRARLRKGERVVSMHEVGDHTVFVVTSRRRWGSRSTVVMLVAGDDVSDPRGLLEEAMACGSDRG